MDDREVAGPRMRRRGIAGWMLLLVGVLSTGPAAAQWAVVDLPHTVKTALGWVGQYQQTVEDLQKQAEQLQTLHKQYEQALVTGDAYSGTAGHRENFETREEDSGLSARCGARPASHRKGPEQYAYCTSIVRTENKRFNALVAMLEDVDERDGELRAAYAERDAIRPEEEGKLASNTNRILSIQGQLQNDVQSGERLMSAYDIALRALRENHVRVANEALSDSGPGSLVAGLALTVALRAARERDR